MITEFALVEGSLNPMAATIEQLDRLTSAFGQNSIVLVLGSGVSVRYGIPTWTDLLKQLTQAILGKDLWQWEEITKALGSSPLVLARFLATTTPSVSDFQTILAQVLYKNFSYTVADPNLLAIVETRSVAKAFFFRSSDKAA